MCQLSSKKPVSEAEGPAGRVENRCVGSMWARLTLLSSDPECVVLQLEGKFFFYLSRKEPKEVEALHCAPGNMCRPENKACLERWKGEREARAV